MRKGFRLTLLGGLLLAHTFTFAQGLGQTRPPGIDVAALNNARQIHERQIEALFRNPRVVATGIGATSSGQPAIKIYLDRTPADAAATGLPDEIEALPVMLEVSGPVYAWRGNCNSPYADPAVCTAEPLAPPGGVDPTARFDRPVPIGVSTGHPGITAGTLGCRVQAGCHNYALSNNHVYANEGAAVIGDDALQPGPYDGGSGPDDIIGQLVDFEPIEFSTSAGNIIDAAIVQLPDGMVGTATPIDGYGQPLADPVTAVPGMNVQKYGRTTGHTSGNVDAINVAVNVQCDAGVARFVQQIVIRPGPFSAGGDSGSLIVVEGGADDRRPVGLLFAGSNSFTLANPITPVLDRFGITIDDGS